MNNISTQAILAVRSDDLERWMNVLLVVILAAFWAIATLVKARVKQNQEQQDQQGQQRRARGSPLATRRTQQPARPRAAPRNRLRTEDRLKEAGKRRAIPAKPTTAEGMDVPTAVLETPEEPKLPSPTMKLEPALQELPELRTSIAARKGVYPGLPAKKPAAESAFQLEDLLDYDDPEELRRAILHYEILGKPLSLRDSGERTIGL